jgi:hypothetical protein
MMVCFIKSHELHNYGAKVIIFYVRAILTGKKKEKGIIFLQSGQDTAFGLVKAWGRRPDEKDRRHTKKSLSVHGLY